MRELDKIANEYYDGDTLKAIKGFFENQQCIDSYVSEFTKEEAEYAYCLIMDDMAEKNGGRKQLGKKFAREIQLQQMNLTEEEILNAKKNPYKSNLLKSFLKLLLIEGGVISVALAGNKINIDSSTLGILASTLTTMVSMDLANSILAYSKFKKIKKQLMNEQMQNNEIINNNIGRSL